MTPQELTQFIVKERSLNGGEQRLYRFPNGYGASVIRGGSFAYGGLEMAVTKYHGDGWDDWNLCYDTPITEDVLGHLDTEMLEDALLATYNLAPVTA